MPGPMPKPAHARQRQNRSSTMRTIEAGSFDHGALPTEYHDLTRQWWQTIWSSPISDAWVDADLPGLLALAQLIEDFWRADADSRAKRHAEVRMASREYGLSPYSRRQLQWEIKKVEGARVPATPPSRRGRAKFSVVA